MERFKKLTLVLAVTAFSLVSVNALAQDGVPVDTNLQDTFIDENGDGVCDTYQAGGQGLKQGNGRGNGAADGTKAKTQQKLRDGSKSGGAYGQGLGDGTGNKTRQGGSGNGRGRK